MDWVSLVLALGFVAYVLIDKGQKRDAQEMALRFLTAGWEQRSKLEQLEDSRRHQRRMAKQGTRGDTEDAL